MTPARKAAIDGWREACQTGDPWDFLTGKDPETGRPVIWTQDERDKVRPIKPFPDYDYLHFLVEILHHPVEPVTVMEKSSQMMISTTVLLYCATQCAFRPACRVLLSKTKEEDAIALIRDKIRFPWSQMPEWLRREIPVSATPSGRATWKRTHSSLLGLAENAATGSARGQTYTIGLIDEAAFQDEFRPLVAAMRSRTPQVVAWSTPHVGEGAEVFQRLTA